jgi:hypothetical protein
LRLEDLRQGVLSSLVAEEGDDLRAGRPTRASAPDATGPRSVPGSGGGAPSGGVRAVR